MIEQKISVVDITIGANMYGRISDLPNTPSHVLAEFVDNALQSSRDKKEQLLKEDAEFRLSGMIIVIKQKSLLLQIMLVVLMQTIIQKLLNLQIPLRITRV